MDVAPNASVSKACSREFAARVAWFMLAAMSLPAIRAFLAAALALALACLPAVAEETAAPQPHHGLATHGLPQLPENFDHFPYADPAAPKGGRLRVGLAGTFDSLNPFNLKAGSTAQGLVGYVFQSLMARSLDEPFTLYALIARSIDIDEARQHLTLHLDPAAHFSDGKPITADDVLFTFELLRTKGRPQQRGAYGLVKAIDAPDPHTVRYDLSGVSDRELPLILAIMPVLPKHAVDVERFSEASLAKPIGSGPYVIASVEPGSRLVLKRDENYWGRDVPSQRGLYNFDEVDLEYYRDGNSMFEAFKAGLLDYREENSTARWASGYDFPAVREGRIVRETLSNDVPKGMQGFVFNTRRALFQDVRLREALGLVFDFEWINANLYSGLFARTKSFFDQSELSSSGRPASAAERALLAPFPGAVREDILEGRWAPPVSDGSGRDRELAKRALELLKDAGYRLEDGVLRKNGDAVAFEIMVTDRSAERLALNWAGSLKRIGVSASVRLVDEVQYQRRRQKFEFDVMIGEWLSSASPGNEQRMRWSSAAAKQESSFNLAGAASPAIDALIKALLAAKSQEEFVAAARAYDRALLSGFYIVPLYHAPKVWIAHSADIARPERLPRYSSPLFAPVLESWWRNGSR